jgi:vancomycin permeability regulator SanA
MAIDSEQGSEKIRAARWIAPFLFAIAAVGETLAMMLMTILRYRNQGLDPQFFDLSKTANMLGLLLEIPFILLFIVMMTLRQLRSVKLAGTAATMALVSVVALTLVPAIPPDDRPVAYVAFLAWKALELAYFAITLDSRKRTFWRKAWSVTIFALVAIAGVFTIVVSAILLSPISSTVIEQPRQEYDAAVILGAAVWSGNKPSPVLRERVNRGFDLLKNGTVQFLVLTGSNAPHELPEAEVARRELLKLGADPTRIVTETRTRSTLEQILFIRDRLMKEQQWSSFIVVSDQFHLKRALEICEFNGIVAHGVSSESPLGPQNLLSYHLRESAALILYWMFGV